MDVSNKNIAKNTVFLYGRLLFSLFIAIYTTRVVLEVLGVIDYAVYNVVCGFVSMFSFVNITLSNGIQRYYNYEVGVNGASSEKRVFQTSLVIMIVVSIIVLVLFESIGVWYINNKMVIPEDRLSAANWIFQFAILSLVLVFLQVPFSASIISHEKMDYFAYVGVGDTLMKLIIVVLLPYLGGDKLIVYGVLLLVISILDFCLYSIYSLKSFQYITFEGFALNKTLFKQIFSFSGWNMIETIAWMSQNQGVNLIMNYFVGPVANAANAIAMQVSNAINGFSSNLSVAFRPQLFQSYAEKEYKTTLNMMYNMSKAIFIVYYLFIVVIGIEIDYIFNLWLGDNIPQYTIPFTLLILFSMIPRNLTMCLSQIVHASGKMKTYQVINSLIIVTVFLTSFYLLKNNKSPISVYYYNIVMCVCLYTVDLFLLKRIFEYSIKEYLKIVLLPICCSIILIPILPIMIHLFMEESFMRFVLVGINTVLSAVIVGYYILLKKKQRRELIMVIISKCKF
ncbi:MAG: hypothetical protein J6R12_01530 [Bacteroidales bacterium]|nr:hypothetical protein [Bacteroidales bacterium]